ncbi:MAG: hypothetical protein K6T59_14055 [Bryobacteraceae bacterium]|jgi:hypothetical protein|nr:hypothetical protein [Bryobacteraceae bacterium]
MMSHSHAARQALRLLDSLCKDDARALERQLRRIRQEAPQSRRMPEAEQERWELLVAIAEALSPDAVAERFSPVRMAACCRLLEHLSAGRGARRRGLDAFHPYSTTNARREPALATRP